MDSGIGAVNLKNYINCFLEYCDILNYISLVPISCGFSCLG